MESEFIRSLGKIETSMALNHQMLAGNTQGCQMVRLNCRFSAEQVRSAARALFDQYDALRVTLQVQDDGFGFYRIPDFSQIETDVFSMTGTDTWLELLEKEVNDVLDPAQSMWRLALYQDDEQGESFLIATFHHSIVDGSGVIVFLNSLLNILDDLCAGGQVSASQDSKPFPVAIDEYLKTKRAEAKPSVSQPVSERIDYQTSNQGLENRKTKMKVLTLKGESFSKFLSACKKNRMSINGVLASNLVKACHSEKLFNEEVELKSAVSLRDRSPNYRDSLHELGCYITVANSVFKVEDDATIGALCKSYDSQLFNAMLKEIVFVNSASNDALKTAISGMADFEHYVHGIGITNAGFVESNEYKHFDIVDWHTINNRCGGNVCIVLHVIQVGSQLNLGFVYAEPLVTSDKIKQVVAAYKQEIESFILLSNEEKVS